MNELFNYLGFPLFMLLFYTTGLIGNLIYIWILKDVSLTIGTLLLAIILAPIGNLLLCILPIVGLLAAIMFFLLALSKWDALWQFLNKKII